MQTNFWKENFFGENVLILRTRRINCLKILEDPKPEGSLNSCAASMAEHPSIINLDMTTKKSNSEVYLQNQSQPDA